MGLDLDYIDGQTPLDEDEKEGLLIETIATRGELDEFEQQNIEQAVLWSLSRSFKPDAVFTEEFLKALNKVASGGKYFTGDVSAIIMKNFVNGTTTSVTPKQAPVETPFKLTKREKQILSLVLQLKNNKDIAEELEISKRTAEVHRFNLMKKLDVKNLLELSNKAKEFGLV